MIRARLLVVALAAAFALTACHRSPSPAPDGGPDCRTLYCSPEAVVWTPGARSLRARNACPAATTFGSAWALAQAPAARTQAMAKTIRKGEDKLVSVQTARGG